MNFEQMNDVQRRLHNAAIVLKAECDKHGFAMLQLDAITEIEQLAKDKAVFALANEVAQGHITELRAEMAEAAEILDNFIGAVSNGGNYSKKTTLVFLGQVRQCLSKP